MIRLALRTGTPDGSKCGTLVVGLFAGERPPRGEAGWADWRVGGAISRAILAGRIDGAIGSTVLMPGGKLPAKRLLVVGLGAPTDFKERALGAALDLALAKLGGLGDSDFAIALPGDKPWPAPKDAAGVIGEHLLRAMAAAARQARVTLIGTAPLMTEVRDWVRNAGDPVASHVVLDKDTDEPNASSMETRT